MVRLKPDQILRSLGTETSNCGVVAAADLDSIHDQAKVSKVRFHDQST